MQKKPDKSQIENLKFLHVQQDFLALEQESRLILENYPNNSDVQNFLGAALAGQEFFDDSLVVFFKAVVDAENGQTKAKILNNIGVSFIKLDDQKNAVNYLKQGIKENPKNLSAHFNLANAFRNLGEVEESLIVYKEALKIDPNHGNSNVYYSLALKILGRFKESIEYCQKALDIRPAWGMAHRHMSTMIKYTEDNDHLKIMLSLIKDPDLPKEEKMHISFGLAKAHEDIGDHKNSFKFLLEANRLFRDDISFSTENSNNYFRAIKRNFSERLSTELQTNPSLGEGLIFIVGMPRSGTSLAEQILSSHSEVFGAGELRHFRKSIDKVFVEIEGKKFPDNLSIHKIEKFTEVGKEYELMISDLRKDSPVFVDKMPYNFMYIPMIRLSLPKSKVVLMERDPIDNCLSIFKQKFGTGNAYAYSLQELAEYYNSYRDITEAWKNFFPNEIFTLNYEELTRSQKIVTSELLDFCDLEWEDSCIDFYKTDRNNKTASSVQVRQPLYSSSVKLWEKYKKELGPLIDNLKV